MIKVNLLDSVTERASSAAVVEERVANPAARFWMLGAAACGVLGLAMVFDFFSASASQAKAKAELEKQKEVAAQMAQVNKEQADLEKKLKDIQSRIDVIKQLRTAQQGPVSLLSDINARIPSDPDFRLDTIEQKGGELTIIGQSPHDNAVTQFARSLEFSDGLFVNVSVEGERKPVDITAADYTPADGPVDLTAKPEVFRFTLKCRYGPNAALPAQPEKKRGGRASKK